MNESYFSLQFRGIKLVLEISRLLIMGRIYRETKGNIYVDKCNIVFFVMPARDVCK